MGSVLVVDDNKDLSRALAKLIQRNGHHAACADNGEDALRLLGERQQGGGLPDLVILDMMMPDMDGLEVLRAIRGNPSTADVPVVVFSAVSDPAFVRHTLDKGATEYWVKASFEFSDLPNRLRRYLQPPAERSTEQPPPESRQSSGEEPPGQL